MILTCPECTTRYTAPDAAFGATGGMFRCAHCGHVWFEKNPHPGQEDAASPAPGGPRLPIFVEPKEEADVTREPPGLRRFLPPPAPRSSHTALFIILLALVNVALLPITFHKPLMKKYPQMATWLVPFGIASGDGLVISELHIAKWPQKDDSFRVEVDCSVANKAKDAQPLPHLVLSLRNKDQVAVSAPASLIDPGTSIPGEGTVPCNHSDFTLHEGQARTLQLDLADGWDLTRRDP